MELYGLAPWVGEGTFRRPYQANVMFISWVWRAKLIKLGFTCWDPVTGEMTSDQQHLADMASVVNSQRLILRAGSSAFVTVEAPSYYSGILDDDFPFADSQDGFVSLARQRRSELLLQLTTDFPTFDWSDPITAAIDVIDTCLAGDAEGQRVWQHYRMIINPSMPTPDGPEELYVTDSIPHRADSSRVAQVTATPQTTANYIWRAELAYRLMTYAEAVAAFDEAGL